jgi:hypothetical protein
MVFLVAKLKIEETPHAALEKTFLNAKTQRHKVAIPEGKYRAANIAQQISRSKNREAIIAQQLSRSNYRRRQISRSNYRSASIHSHLLEF